MPSVLSHPQKSTDSAWARGLPARLRVLYIATTHRTGAWLAEALAADSATEIHLEEAFGSMAGLARLREEIFDAVLVSHQPGELDALELIEGYRTGVADVPIIVLGTQSEQEMCAQCYELGAEAYACVNTTTTRDLLWVLARGVERHQLLRENQRLHQAQQRRLQQEHEEAYRLLSQQRALIEGIEALWCDGKRSSGDSREAMPATAAPDEDYAGYLLGKTTFSATGHPRLPEELVEHYRELLRTYVIMGSGNLADELRRLGEMLTTAGVDAGDAMQLHVYVLEELLRGLGSRSTRHVMTRADMLALEIMIHLAEGYRCRYLERRMGEAQRLLPGFEDFAEAG